MTSSSWTAPRTSSYPSPPPSLVKQLENNSANVSVHEGNPIIVELPASVELMLTYTEPGVQGDRSTGGTKPATLETGAEIQVPLFIEPDTKVKVDTRDGSYLGRVND